MDLAVKSPEDQEFVAKFLKRSHHCLLQSRLLVEDLLSQEGISYSQKGYDATKLELSVAYKPISDSP